MKLGKDYRDAVKNLEFDTLKETLEDFKQDLDTYKEKCYSNVFYLMNLRENTQSELLAYLFDISNNKNNFQKNFIKEFCKCISNEDVKNIDNVQTQNTLENNSRPDIIIEASSSRFIIEVKLDAEINIKDNKTQLENYWNSFNKDNNKDKKNYLVFIYVNEEILKKHGKENACFIGKDSYKIDDYEKLKKLQDLLQEEKNKKFICIEFSDIVLILNKIFKLQNDNKKTSQEQKNIITCGLIKKLSGYLEDTTDNKKINIKKINGIKERIEEYKEEKITKNQLIKWEYKKPKYCNISDLKTKLKKWEENDIKNLLIQFIDYWQYISLINDSYSEIINIKNEYYYIWDICEEIKIKEKEKYGQIEEKIKNEIKEIEQIKVYNAPTK